MDLLKLLISDIGLGGPGRRRGGQGDGTTAQFLFSRGLLVTE